MNTNRLCLIGIVLASVGCTSLRSTFLARDESNSCWQCTKLDGVPITLKVPTHVQVVIQETRYLVPHMAKDLSVSWVPLKDGSDAAGGQPITAMDVKHEFIRTEKIFTVDFKRPAAGTIKFSADFDNQYLTKMSSDIEDRTIAEVSLAIERVMRVLPRRAGADLLSTKSLAGLTLPEIKEVTSVRAARVFEVDDPMFEVEMAHFMETHLCAEMTVVPPGKTAPHAQSGLAPEPLPAPAALDLTRRKTAPKPPVLPVSH